MKKTLYTLALMLIASVANATPLINAGFESGNLDGWTTGLSGGTANVVSSHTASYLDSETYLPVEGGYFLAIGTNGSVMDDWQTVSQTFTLAAGDVISGSAAFDWGDVGGFVDGARVRILDSDGNDITTVFYEDGVGHEDGYNGAWIPWDWTADFDGIYTLEYGVRNLGDDGSISVDLMSYGYFDAPEITTSVPEPASIALLGIALAGLGLSRRKS